MVASVDAKLSICTGEVTLDGFERHIELVGDFSVGPTIGRQLRDTQLSRTQGLQACAPLATWACAGGFEFLTGACCQRSGAAPGRKVQSLGKRFARGGTGPMSSHRRAQLGQGMRL